MKRAAAKPPLSPPLPTAAVDLTEGDIDRVLKADERLPAAKKRLSFNTYGKSESESSHFNRIMFRAGPHVAFERTNYVQCRVCHKLLVAKLTGGSNPARHRKHCKGRLPLVEATDGVQAATDEKAADGEREPLDDKTIALMNSLLTEDQREVALKVLEELASGDIDEDEASARLETAGADEAVGTFVRELVSLLGAGKNELGDEAVDLTERFRAAASPTSLSAVGGTVQHSNTRSRASSHSATPTPDFEHPARAAYRIRQTYIFMRVQGTNKPVLCKANDEDFFPPNRTTNSAVDRSKLLPGQIITTYFGYDQVKTACVVEAVGEWDVVLRQLREQIAQEVGGGKKQKNADDFKGSLMDRFFGPEEEKEDQNGGECSSPSSSESLNQQPPAKIARREPPAFSHDQIARRFEDLEARVRVLEGRFIPPSTERDL